jgi:hypothetical protein
MPRLTVLVILLFTITFALYLGGYTSYFLKYYNKVEGKINPIDIFRSTEFLSSVGLGLAGGIAASLFGGGYAVFFTIPLAFTTFFFMNYFVFPLSFFSEASLPLEIRLLLFGFFVTLEILTLISFVAGRD